MENKIYSVTMKHSSGVWVCKTSANSKFQALLQMTKKYISMSAMAVDAVVVKNHEWKIDV